MSQEVSRRVLIQAGFAGAAAALPAPVLAQEQTAQQPQPPNPPADPADVLFFFTEPEARFMTAAVNRLIPPDPRWPGAADAGVVTYIDRQLASGYGEGAKMYLKGPWVPDAPTQQGYQLRYTPAELYRRAIAETGEIVRQSHNGQEFWDLDALPMDDILKGLETGGIALPSLPSPVFFESLLANTIEGWFADPAYGGNRDMVAWRMIGFPGAYAQYVDLVEEHGHVCRRPPISIADGHARQVHLSGHGQ
jgi:gluconate 2-dehydrogenase gamma chain